jgi:hypothetical protein
MQGAGAANRRRRPAVSVFIEASYSKICASLPLGSLLGISSRSICGMAAKQHTRLQIIFVFIRVHSWRKTFRPSGLGATKSVSARNIHPVYFAPGPKTKVKTLFTLTGSPLRIAGAKTHLRAASSAAFRSAK